GDQAWFFRLSGPPDPVAGLAENFRTFVKSLRFAAEDAPPVWQLPEGWRQKPGSGMRYATIEVDAPAAPLDLSVTVLPPSESDSDAYTLANVNRWRGQLGLPPLAASQLPDNVEQLDLGG